MADLNLILTIAFAFGLALGNSIAFLSVACQEKKIYGLQMWQKKSSVNNSLGEPGGCSSTGTITSRL